MDIDGGKLVRARLAVHGIVRGARLQVLQRGGRGRGGTIVMRGDTRLALGWGEASTILIRAPTDGLDSVAR